MEQEDQKTPDPAPHTPPVTFDARAKLRCIERELRMRERNYPRWVAEGRMVAGQAQYEIDVMSAIADDYRKALEAEEPRLL